MNRGAPDDTDDIEALSRGEQFRLNGLLSSNTSALAPKGVHLLLARGTYLPLIASESRVRLPLVRLPFGPKVHASESFLLVALETLKGNTHRHRITAGVTLAKTFILL